jgi:hypothetical protein
MPPYLADEMNGSLSYNRFSWWSKVTSPNWFARGPNGFAIPPPPGFFVGYGAMSKNFECEFNHPLASIVGTRVEPLAANGYSVISWKALANASPNDTPGIQFAVQTHAPDSVPRLRPFADAGSDQGEVVLVNEGFPRPGVTLPPGQVRPALWIEFDRPQRAVGLEFGFQTVQGIDRSHLGRGDVRLTAYDRNQQPLEKISPDGFHIPIQSDVEPLVPSTQSVARGTAFNRVGVIDIDGRISLVKLEFINGIVEPQVVSRIWHEATVPAVVKQGCLLIDSDPQASIDNNIPIPPVCEAVGPITHSLPARCDRAAVMMRGFKYGFLDDQPHKLYFHGAGIHDPSTFQVEPGGAVTLNPFGFLDTDPSAASPHYRVLVYYSLLAWDSTQVELLTTTGFLSDHVMNNNLNNWITLTDPCQEPPMPWSQPDAQDVCGPLFGGLQWFVFSTSQPREINEIDLTMATEMEKFGLHRVGPGVIKYGIYPTLKTKDGQGFDVGVAGTVLTGRSLRVGPDPLSKPGSDISKSWLGGAVGLVERKELPRPSFDSWTTGWSAIRGISLAYPIWDRHDDQTNHDVPADMAFLAVRDWEFQPEGPVRELEVEVRGERYDESCAVDWQWAVGISSNPKGHDDPRFAFAEPPTFAAVVRNTLFAKPQLLIQNLGFVGLIGGSAPPAQLGAIANQGDAACSITAVERGGRDDALFQYMFLLRNQSYDFNALQNVLPLRLRAGEVFMISGLYTAAQPAGGGEPPNVASLTFRTTSQATPNIAVTVQGVTAGIGLLQGHVKDAAGKAIADASVLVGTTQLSTNADGSYSLMIQQGVYSVSVIQSGFVPSRETVTVLSSTTANFVLTPALIFTLQGQVIDKLGNPVPGATVRLTQIDAGVPGILTTATKFNGFYTFSENPGSYDGSYGMDVFAAGFAETSLNIGKIANGASISEAPITLGRMGTVTGKVTDASKTPLAGALVLVGKGIPVVGSPKTINFSSNTNSTGDYSITVDPPGSYNVVATQPFFEDSAPAAVTVSVDKASPANFVLVKADRGTITGFVTDVDSGDPITATVEAIVENPSSESKTTETDSDGGYTLSDVLSGQRQVVASAKRYFGASRTVQVTAGSPATANFALASKRPSPRLSTRIALATPEAELTRILRDYFAEITGRTPSATQQEGLRETALWIRGGEVEWPKVVKAIADKVWDPADGPRAIYNSG